MSDSKKFVGALACGVAAISLMAAMPASAKVEGDTITLGSAISFTGKYSTNGIHAKNGYLLGVQRVNEMGGVAVGGKKYKLAVKFYDDESTPARTAQLLERLIKPIEEKLGLPRFSWHDFRHAYTTWGRQAGVEAEGMRDQVGHASVAMTQDVYTHFGDRGAAADRIGAHVFAADDVEQTA